MINTPFRTVVFFLTLLLFTTACKKENVGVVKKIDYITKNNDNLRINYIYDGEEVKEVIYDHKYYIEKYFYKDGMLVLAELQDDKFIEYIFSDSLITAVRSWVPDKKYIEYYYNAKGQIYKKVDYSTSYNIVTSEYTYQNNNLIERKRIGASGVTYTRYTYDNHPNPYNVAPIYDEPYMLSKNNMLTADGEKVVDYKYDADGYLIESQWLPTIVDKYYYK